MTMRRVVNFSLALTLCALAAVPTYAQQVVDQGMPGTQGCWPVSICGTVPVLGSDGGAVPVNITQSIPLTVQTDGGFVGYTFNQPCRQIVQTNDAGVGTSASVVPPSGPQPNRIWIRVCNDLSNNPATLCRCSTSTCPSTAGAGGVGDLLAVADCVTYPIGANDGGIPCCICNGLTKWLPTSECIP